MKSELRPGLSNQERLLHTQPLRMLVPQLRSAESGAELGLQRGDKGM